MKEQSEEALRDLARKLGIPFETLTSMETTMTEANQALTSDENEGSEFTKRRRPNTRFGVRLPRRIHNALLADAEARGQIVGRRAAEILIGHYGEPSGQAQEAPDSSRGQNVTDSER